MYYLQVCTITFSWMMLQEDLRATDEGQPPRNRIRLVFWRRLPKSESGNSLRLNTKLLDLLHILQQRQWGLSLINRTPPRANKSWTCRGCIKAPIAGDNSRSRTNVHLIFFAGTDRSRDTINNPSLRATGALYSAGRSKPWSRKRTSELWITVCKGVVSNGRGYRTYGHD